MSRPSRSKGNHFTRGGQITFHSIRMFFQVNNTLVYAAIWAVITLNRISHLASCPGQCLLVCVLLLAQPNLRQPWTRSQ